MPTPSLCTTFVALVFTIYFSTFQATAQKPTSVKHCSAYFDQGKTLDFVKSLNIATCHTIDFVGAIPEDMACIAKCMYQKRNFFGNDMKLSTTKVQEFYTKVSNATADQVKTIMDTFEHCDWEATKKLDALKKIGKVVGNCMHTALFDTCYGYSKAPKVC